MIIDPIRKIKLFMTCDIGVVRAKNKYELGIYYKRISVRRW